MRPKREREENLWCSRIKCPLPRMNSSILDTHNEPLFFVFSDELTPNRRCLYTIHGPINIQINAFFCCRPLTKRFLCLDRVCVWQNRKYLCWKWTSVGSKLCRIKRKKIQTSVHSQQPLCSLVTWAFSLNEQSHNFVCVGIFLRPIFWLNLILPVENCERCEKNNIKNCT